MKRNFAQIDGRKLKVLTRNGIDLERGVAGNQTVTNCSIDVQVGIFRLNDANHCAAPQILLDAELVCGAEEFRVVVVRVHHIDNYARCGGCRWCSIVARQHR